jgi:hypothetical protein
LYSPVLDIREGFRLEAEARAKKKAEAEADRKNIAEKEAMEQQLKEDAEPPVMTNEQQIELLVKAVADLTIRLNGNGEK